MPRQLHLFFPENDIALVSNKPHFTPPAAARDIHIAGEALPLWYGNVGDEVLTGGINARWYEHITQLFDIGPTLHNLKYNPDLRPAPWGWSAASRTSFIDVGYPPEALPSDEELCRWRQLSHRRTSAMLAEALHSSLPAVFAVPAVEVHTVDQAMALLHDMPKAVVKTPYSSSGRGLMFTGSLSADYLRQRIDATIRRQSSVMVEPAISREADFALLFDSGGDGTLKYIGLSLFRCDALGHYRGNVLTDDATIASLLGIDNLDRVISSVTKALTPLCAGAYIGPLGVDMMTSCDGMIAVAEINFRMTMGRVAHTLARRYICAGSIGSFVVTTNAAGIDTTSAAVVSGGKIISGGINLVPDGLKFRFMMYADDHLASYI